MFYYYCLSSSSFLRVRLRRSNRVLLASLVEEILQIYSKSTNSLFIVFCFFISIVQFVLIWSISARRALPFFSRLSARNLSNLTNLFKIYQFSFYCLLPLYIFCSICSDLVDFLRPAGSKRLLRRRALLEEHSLFSVAYRREIYQILQIYQNLFIIFLSSFRFIRVIRVRFILSESKRIQNAGPILADVSADIFLVGMSCALLYACGLVLVIHASVPEASNVDGVVLDEIHQLVQPIDENAAVSHRTVAEQRIDLPDAWTAHELLNCVINLLLESLGSLSAKLFANVGGYLALGHLCSWFPMNFHKLRFCIIGFASA